MKQHAQLKIEIRRQSGEIIAGMVPVDQNGFNQNGFNQKGFNEEGYEHKEFDQEGIDQEGINQERIDQEGFILGNSRVCLEERRSGAIQIVSLHLELKQEEHWVFDGLEQDAPIRVYVPLEPKPEKMTALYLFSDWWTRPAFVERYEEIPPNTQVLLIKGKEGFACLVPMVGQQWKATVNGGTEDAVCLELGAGVGGYMRVEEPLYILAEADTISEAVHLAFTWLAREKGILTRRERRVPEHFRSLGWCSWNAFYTEVDENGLRQKAEEFAKKSVPVRWMIIDDGWMSTRDTFLTGFAPDRKKFPHGFSQMVKDIRQSSTIRKFGVWHALGGYWSGVQKQSELAGQEADHLRETVNGLLVPDPEKGADFYRHWYQLLRREGIDFVKVDGQSTAARYFRSTLPISSAVRGMNEALECGASPLDNTILNCMGMAMENVLARPASAVSRNSDDFFPDREGSFTEHILENAYNAIYHDELYCCDWDMFWTSHPDGRKHSLLRAISGGPVYFSDRVGETNPDVLRPLSYLDGTLPVMIRSARPAEDCVFSDPRKEGVLKLHNAAPWGSGMAGGIAVFNLTREQQSFSFAPSDIPELEKSPRYWVYDWFGKCAYSIGKDERFEGTEAAQGFGWYVLLPEKESLSCLGLTEKYVGFAAVESVVETPGSTTVVLRETGPISWLSHRVCVNVELNGVDVTALVSRKDLISTLTEDLTEKALPKKDLPGKDLPEENLLEKNLTDLGSDAARDGGVKKNAAAALFTLTLEEKPEKAVLCIKW